MKKPSLFILCMAVCFLSYAQENFWKHEGVQSATNVTRLVIPHIYQTFSLSFDQYKTFLNAAPVESLSGINKGLLISLPYPDNSFRKFRIVETKMMQPGLAAQFPEIRTYLGQGIDDPAATVRIDYTSQGFHAYVLSPEGSLFIDPYQKGNNNLYLSYLSKDYINPAKEQFKCRTLDVVDRNAVSSSTSAPLAGICIGTELKTYKTAISCTGEYAAAVCPAGNVTLANTLSAIVTTMNRVNGVYQTELGIKMILVNNETSVIYTDAGTDPYSTDGNSNPEILMDESSVLIDSAIGNGNYDIGHTLSTGEGGVANPEVACKGSLKSNGVSGLPDPQGDKYDIDFVAHEIGHQFGASHTFESVTEFCGGGNRVKSSAYEVGSGTTIMAYAGICDTDNIQLHTDPYFHTRSFDQIIEYTTNGVGSTCPVVTGSGNTPPELVMPVSGLKIPKSTPFTLSGTASDINGDVITYSWEQWDISSSSVGSTWNAGANSINKPLFKARVPKLSGSRTFPDMAVILANYPANPPVAMGGLKGETLPAVARDIKFRLVARDNNATAGGVVTGGSGCSSSNVFYVRVTNDGPFKITSPNTAVTWPGGSTQTITWDVANTNSDTGINVQNVDILMSTDGGNTYTTTIIANTPNNGTKSITVPNILTNNTVRFMVRAAGSVFFDISDVNSTIVFSAVLPVSLLRFSAQPDRNSILLTWSTSTESNNKGFNILRSESNDNNFISIGFIKPTGNNSPEKNYTLTDKNVKKGVVYFYRLQQIDLNNNVLYSDIRRAKLGLTGLFSASVQPQPFHNTAYVYLDGINKEDLTIITSDVMGRVVNSKKLKNNQQTRLVSLDLGNQADGVYFIKILQHGISTTIKAVKQ